MNSFFKIYVYFFEKKNNYEKFIRYPVLKYNFVRNNHDIVGNHLQYICATFHSLE